MKRSNTMKLSMKPIVAACALALAAGQAGAVDYYLIAKAFSKNLPDGSTVTMWGFAEDVAGACWNVSNTHPANEANAAAAMAARLTAPACTDPAATAPGPRLIIAPTDPNLRIMLTNLLPEPTSINVPGQELPWSENNNGPTWNDGWVGPRGNNLERRVRSYGVEAPADGGSRSYRWTNFRENPIGGSGTFVYHTGTHPQKQLYMGLYGTLTKDAAAGEIYTGVPYINDITLFYSDIDPAFNAAVVAGTLGTAIERHPSWFLINGEPYAAGMPAIAAGATGEQTLVRFLSAATEKHVPVFQGLYGTIHAEDGIQYTWQDGAAVMDTAPLSQYSVGLPPLKTKDVMVNPVLPGDYAVYDGNGYMTNPSDPDDPNDGGDNIGGMLRFLSFTQGVVNLPPVTLADELTIEFAAGANTGVSGTVNVLLNDNDPEGMPLTVSAFDATTPEIGGTVSCIPAGDCTFTPAGGDPDPYTTGIGTFTYTADDGNGTTTATVTVNVIENLAPTPMIDDVAADTGIAVDFNVLTNDLDPEIDTLSIVTLDATGVVEGALSCDNGTGDCTYTPPAIPTVLPLVETFTYTIDDGINPESDPPTSVTITVTDPIPAAPVAVADSYNVDEDAILDVAAPGVLDNDTDANGDALSAVLVSGPVNARADASDGGFTFGSDGSFHYEPAVDFNGDDSFVYLANDGTGDSNQVTVTITVNPQNDAPIANNDTLLLQNAALTTLDPDGQPIETIFVIAAPGVLDNDVDVDVDVENDAMTAAEVNDPDDLTPSLASDGSATFVADNAASGIVGSLSYEATDANAAVSNLAQADFLRLVSLRRSEYNEREDANPANDDWRIRGSVDASIAPGTQVHVFLVRGGVDVAEIVPTVNGNNNGQVRNNLNWGINANNSGPQPQPGDTLRVEVEGHADAVYLNYPVFIQP